MWQCSGPGNTTISSVYTVTGPYPFLTSSILAWMMRLDLKFSAHPNRIIFQILCKMQPSPTFLPCLLSVVPRNIIPATAASVWLVLWAFTHRALGQSSAQHKVLACLQSPSHDNPSDNLSKLSQGYPLVSNKNSDLELDDDRGSYPRKSHWQEVPGQETYPGITQGKQSYS